MGLSEELISQFVQVTNDTKQKKNNSESTVYGQIVEYEGNKYVRIDGSDLLTPVSATASSVDGDRVTVLIKNHTATVTGNISSPSARIDDLTDQTDAITALGIVVSRKVDTKDLVVEQGRIDALIDENVIIKESLTVAKDDIEDLKDSKLDADVAEATYAKIESLSPEQKILWGEDSTSGMYMTADHEITLKEAISVQRNGIVLVFCTYDGIGDTNYNWQSFFVPKRLVALTTSEHTFVLSTGKFTYTGTKYLYINDTTIIGHADNNLTGSNNGIAYANNKFVLRYVIGV